MKKFIQLLRKIRRLFLSTIVRWRAKECGQNLKVNHWSSISRNTFLGNNVGFNGMTIAGGV